MRILLITDQGPDSQHSAIRGIFDHHLRAQAEVTIVWFSRHQKKTAATPGHLVLPWRYRRHGGWWRFLPSVRLADFDIVIVRNLFPVLSGLTGMAKRPFRLGFWESFPHRYRRLYEARQSGRALWRKRAEYAIFRRIEENLVSRCDFYLPITATFAREFRPGVAIPMHPLPMGVDVDNLPPIAHRGRSPGPPLRLFYAGAADALRGFDFILPALCSSGVDFVLDIYTFAPSGLLAPRLGSDPRIRILPGLPRRELLVKMNEYDLGLSLIPPSPLYDVSSPTKTLEYFAMGLPALMTPLPEHVSLFGELTPLFVPWDHDAIAGGLRRVAALPAATLHDLAAQGRETVLRERAYANLAQELHAFLGTLP